MKLHCNEIIVSSHPVQIDRSGWVEKLLLVTSFGRMFFFYPASLHHELADDRMAS